MKITFVAGARPNFMKIAPILKQIKQRQMVTNDLEYRLVHTGQHFDSQMSSTFFDQLRIPSPDINLNAGRGTQAEQTAAIMIGFERELIAHPTDVVVVVGDVNSTMACAITAKKMCVCVVHVEAGIRSGDLSMPEEINRMVTDSISDYFFTTSESANQHLRNAGIIEERIHFVGNTMIDTLFQNLHRLQKPNFWDKHQLKDKSFFLMTLHRPSNVDDPERLIEILTTVMNNNSGKPVVFPVHPRTKRVIDQINYEHDSLLLLEPLGYLEFMYLVKHSKAVITDSGGITEETTALKVPCLTLRNCTERPETVDCGSNELIGTDTSKLIEYLDRINNGRWKDSSIPDLWDGKSAERIVSKLVNLLAEDRISDRAVVTIH